MDYGKRKRNVGGEGEDVIYEGGGDADGKGK